MFNKRLINGALPLTVILTGLASFGQLLDTANAQQATGQSVDLQSKVAVVSGHADENSGSENEYRIGPGDELTIQVFNRTQLSREERVDMTGVITMPLLDEQIRAACRTEGELSNEIARLYRAHDLLKNPSVFVKVKDFQSQPVAVLGSVNQPGRFALRRRIRLLELIVFFAGGPNTNAGTRIQVLSTVPAAICEESGSQATTQSQQNDKAEAGFAIYSVADMLAGKESANPYVHQGDIINIPALEQAYVIGNVARPSPIQISGTVTLGKALAMVGGVLPNSKKEKIRISREIPGGNHTTEILVDLAAPDRSHGEDFPLQAGDIVQVAPKSGFQTVLKQWIIPSAIGLPSRVVP